MRLIFSILKKLSSSLDEKALKQEIAEDVLRLLRADFYISFQWDTIRLCKEPVALFNVLPSMIKIYEGYYHSCDPITPLLQQRQNASLVSKVIGQDELEKTEFFNDFLNPYRFHHGMNLYINEKGKNIGDMLIYRKRSAPDFGKREVALLELLKPYFRNALINARQFGTMAKLAAFRHTLLDHLEIPLFLFDSIGQELFRNKKALAMEERYSESEFSSFYLYIQSLIKMKNPSLEFTWKGIRLSIFHLDSSDQEHSATAVMALDSLSQQKSFD